MVSTLLFGKSIGPCKLVAVIISDVVVRLPSTNSIPVATNCSVPAELKVFVIVLSVEGEKAYDLPFSINNVLEVYVGSGVIVKSTYAFADLADLGVYPIVFAIETTEFLFTAESINDSFAIM